MARSAHLLALVTALAFLGGCGATPPPGEEPPVGEAESSLPFLLGGIQVNEASHDGWFAALAEESMNAVEVTVYVKQGDWDTDHLWGEEEEPWVVEEIRGAKARGLRVVFVLRVALDHAFERNAFLWHGMIMPRTDELRDSWFRQYREVAVKWASVAAAEGVDCFVVGSEMNSLASTLPVDEVPVLEEYFLAEEKQEERRDRVLANEALVIGREMGLRERELFPTASEYIDSRIAVERSWAELMVAGGVEGVNRRRRQLDDGWRLVIAAVRSVYAGPVGYAANFDQYDEVGFWDALDVLGINAYFELREELVPGASAEALYPALLEGWREVLGRIVSFRAAHDLDELPVLFTEIGYTFRAESTLRPWADTGFATVPVAGTDEHRAIVWRDQPPRPAERALAIRALHEAHAALGSGFLRGLLWWKLSSHEYHQKDESFMLLVGAPSPDPVLPELRRFSADEPKGPTIPIRPGGG